MAQLRVYKKNGRDMLELVRYQKKELSMAAGAEDICFSAEDVLKSERKNRQKLGDLADLPMYSIPYTNIKKIAALKGRIWGL
jgi:endo-alpha-1,4-polygalactosaminidase (GH114 family)